MTGYGNFVDHFGVQYQKVNIMSNGLCGYSSIAYSVSGNPRGFVSVIDDSFSAFEMNPELFRQQTDVGRATTLIAYREKMRVAMQNVMEGKSLPEVLWMEDGHLVLYSLMFEISIFVYNTVLHEWYVYNDNGERGYVCLVFNGSHYDVLIGLSNAPSIPTEVKRRGLDRVSLNWIEVPVDQQRYTFDFVWKWPSGKPQISILNELSLPGNFQPVANRKKSTNARTFIDSFFTENGVVQYKKIDILSNGLCGYSCIAYSVIGDSRAHVPVIENCLDAFELNPTLFNQQTEMGTDVLFCDYKEIMRVSVGDMETGGSFPKRLWMEDGHIVVCSLMFDVSIYVFNILLNEWYVYNENAQKGYICLVFSGSHYDVLISPSNTHPPPVPNNAKRHGPSHGDTEWIEVPVDLEKYSFAHVWKWPKPRPAVVMSAEMTRSSASRTFGNSKKTDLSTTILKPIVVSPKPIGTKSSLNLFKCTVMLCDRVFKKSAGLRMHQARCHNDLTVLTDEVVNASVNGESNISTQLSSVTNVLIKAVNVRVQSRNDSDTESICSDHVMNAEITQSSANETFVTCIKNDLSATKLEPFLVVQKASNTKSTPDLFECTVLACKRVFKTSTALRMHHIRCHNHLKVITNEVINASMNAESNVSTLDSLTNKIGDPVFVPIQFINTSDTESISSVTSIDRKHVQYLHVASDDESLCSVSRKSGEESMDSDCSISSTHTTRSNSGLPVFSSELFKTPQPKSSRQTCKDCGKSFVNMSKHLKCSRKLLAISTDNSLSSSESMTENVDTPKTSPTMKKQCMTCFVYFVDLSKHKRCTKAKDYDKPTQALKRLESESVLNMPLITSDGDKRSSRSSSLSSRSSTKSFQNQSIVSQDATNQVNFIDSFDLSDCSLSTINNSPISYINSSTVSSDMLIVTEKNTVHIKQRRVGGRRCFVCNLCNIKFRTKRLLNGHILNCNANNVPLADTGIDQLNSVSDKTPSTPKHKGATRKIHIARDFKTECEKLKQKYLSAEVVEQVDPLYDALKVYQQDLGSKINNVTTEKLSPEVLNVILNPDTIGDDRELAWSPEEQHRLNQLNIECKQLQRRNDWYWDPEPNSPQAIYNEKRLELCMNVELVHKLINCKRCLTTSVLVGEDQTGSIDYCYDCLDIRGKENKYQKELDEAWQKVKPISREYPRRTDPGHTNEDLPYLYPGDKAVIALVHPIVTVKKTYFRNKQLRQESISLLGEPDKTWVKVLPRDDLKERFFVLERTGKNGQRKHIVANRDRVEQWLKFLFINHGEYKRRLESGELEISEKALECLQEQSELASVDTTEVEAEDLSPDPGTEYAMIQPALESGFIDHHIIAFDKFPNMYLKKPDFLKIRQGGKIEIITDESERRPIYSASANLAFPNLFAHGESCPTDFGSYLLARDLLKKQMMFAQQKSDGKLVWPYSDDDIYMMHQFARLTEMRVHARVGFYISQHPSAAHLPLDSVVNAFKNGFDEMGLLDSRLPDLTMMMTQLPNSRQYWFQERQGLETMARDLSDACLFLTINPEPRHSPDVRELIHSLEFPGKPFDRDWTFESTEQFTELMSKYAPHVSVYLWRKTKIFMSAFLNDICRIPKTETSEDWTKNDRSENSFYWFRTEFTSTRGFPHFHCLIRLPNTLETGVLGRMTSNMRIVRQEMKCNNIDPAKKELAWEIIRFGLLASRYLVLLADSISSASFYTERVGSSETVDPSKVIDVDLLRAEFEQHSKTGTHTNATHPLMRKFDDPECDPNPYVDYAQLAAATLIHQCIANGSCGGDPKTGNGCRFSYPKKLMNYTVAAVMQVNSEQSETQVLLRRTNKRVCSSNNYITRYLRCNNDVQLLADTGHSMRYCTKYCTKSAKHDVLLNEMVEHINSRNNDLMQPTVRQALSHLILADCSHRAFMSKHELSWNIMGLPDVSKSFSAVKTVAFYPRANLSLAYRDEDVIEYSDRTEYTAYAERCLESTVVKLPKRSEEEKSDYIKNMSLREFAERISYRWQSKDKLASKEIGARCKRQYRNRDVNSGHWIMSFNSQRKHIRSSIRLFTKPAIEYELVDEDECTSQTAFFDQPHEKRQQLLRSYQELVFYVPWQSSPDLTFLSEDMREALNDDPEKESRYSMRRLQAFFKVYQMNWEQTFRPKSCVTLNMQTRTRNEQWFRDNQYSYSMFLANDQNSDLRLDRIANKGVLNPTYEDADELQGTDVSIQPSVVAENDAEGDYPSVLNFCVPNDGLREILHQPLPTVTETQVIFPLQHAWQTLEDMVRKDKVRMFMARPPPSPITESQMTDMQRFAYECMLDEQIRVMYVCGKAGCGKSTVALLACEKLKGRVQCAAGTGRAASIFNAPTVHSALQWSLRGSDNSGHSAAKIGQMQAFYENIDVFVFDEVNALSAECLARIHDTMTSIFNPSLKKGIDREVLPFGGKKIIFLGDPAQLRPVQGSPIYENVVIVTAMKRKGASRQMTMNIKGQMLYRKFLLPNTILLKKGQRNAGLLQIICDRLRNGEQTSDDLAKLTWLRRKFPDAVSDFGIHYDNESCNEHNLRQLWNDCQNESPSRRLYICKATYEDTGSNASVIDGLSCLPAKFYDYAPNMLCLSEMCLVRITKNINVGAGLVNGTIGQVVQILYDNADMPALLDGKHPPPHCIVVNFEGFQGFVLDTNQPNERFFPIENHETWVPIYREKIYPNSTNIPSWIRKKQTPYQCYRQQFPLDLALHMTSHRSQGQTLANAIVSADMNLDNPDKSTPADIGSVIYVALTRVRNLVDLLVSPIYPSAWEKIGKSEMDDRRRKADADLVKSAEAFAISQGKLDEYQAEQNFEPDYGDIDQEWSDIKSMTAPPTRKRPSTVPLRQAEALEVKFKLSFADEISMHPLCLAPALSERHIGIDQGTRNFAIVCVDKRGNDVPKVVAAELYDLNLPRKFSIIDLASALFDITDLTNWMQLDETMLLERVDRVVVHIEQMSVKNANSREFTIGLGKYLQSRAIDMNTCVVKLSQANVHRRNGPIFKLGDEIVNSLSLVPSSYKTKRKDFDRKRPAQVAPVADTVCSCTGRVSKKCKAKKHINTTSDQRTVIKQVDMETDAHVDSSMSNVQSEAVTDVVDDEYARKKSMSSAIFQYFMYATQEQQLEMGVEIDESVQEEGQAFISHQSPKPKLDDLGDALLHSLNELLCGSTNYKQFVSSSSAVSNNRTVVIAVLPHTTYWIALHCQFNLFTLEDLGTHESKLEGQFFRSNTVEKLVNDRLTPGLRTALTDFGESLTLEAVSDIKIIVKQLQGLNKYDLTRPQAGSLTQTTYNAMKILVDRSSPTDSKVCDKKDKTGHSYVRTNDSTGHTFHVLKSSGKHLNAVVSFLEWFKENANRVLEQRDADLNQSEKLRFFETLQCLAKRDEPRLEMMKLSEVAKAKLASGVFRDMETKKLLADLILISINKNQGHVKAIAGNYREFNSRVVTQKSKSKHSKNKSRNAATVFTKKATEESMVVETEDQQFSDVEPD